MFSALCQFCLESQDDVSPSTRMHMTIWRVRYFGHVSEDNFVSQHKPQHKGDLKHHPCWVLITKLEKTRAMEIIRYPCSNTKLCFRLQEPLVQINGNFVSHIQWKKVASCQCFESAAISFFPWIWVYFSTCNPSRKTTVYFTMSEVLLPT